MANPVWRAFVATQMEVWIDFFNNHHIESYIQMIERFIRLNPYYVPNQNDIESDSAGLLYKLLWNETFNESLSEKGMRVWVASPFTDFIEELKVYQTDYREIALLVVLFSRHILWFERLYAHMRRMMIERYNLTP
jgi:hypothetical protein